MRITRLIVLLSLSVAALAESKKEFSAEQNRQARWFAQDRQYQSTAPGIVDDLASGLRWQQHAPDRQLNWQAAVDYCGALSLAGITTWRLPSRLELLSLLNYDNEKHAYDSAYFDSEPAVTFWSGTVYDNMRSHVWIAQFGEGDMYCLMRVAQAHVRCVI